MCGGLSAFLFLLLPGNPCAISVYTELESLGLKVCTGLEDLGFRGLGCKA